VSPAPINARVLCQTEGGRACAAQIRAITTRFRFGHIDAATTRAEEALSIKAERRKNGFYFDAARVIEHNGGFALLRELIDPPAAAEITQAVSIPTIGIGSGTECDGQILVFHDLVGYFPWFKPKHANPEGDVAGEIRKAVRAYIHRTRGNVE
jgi:3-methyl-2-oxobutanoate hydroxymethyltransferase